MQRTFRNRGGLPWWWWRRLADRKRRQGDGVTAPAYRSHTLNAYASRPTGFTLDKPSGVAADDILVACVVHSRTTPAQNDLVAPAGWTKIGTSPIVTAGGMSAKLEVWWKRATGSEPTGYFFDVWASSSNQGAILAYSGCLASGSPIDVFSQNSASTGSTATGTGVTTTSADDTLVWLGHNWDASGALTAPSGMTERFDNLLYCADQTIASAGATGDRTQTLASSNPWATYMLALTSSH
jgi:hypothetical protein